MNVSPLRFRTSCSLTAFLVCLGAAVAAQQKVEKSNMDLVGYSDLQARSAYQPTIHKQGERWIAYIGHHGASQLNTLTGQKEDNGTSIVDVTDPKRPRYLAHIPGEAARPGGGESGGAQMARVCDGSSLPRADKSKVYLLRSFGGSAHEMWDVTDPAKPTRLTVVVSGLRDTLTSSLKGGEGLGTLGHISIDPSLMKNFSTSYYEAGHMMYIDEKSLTKLHTDVTRFMDDSMKR